MVQAQRPPRSGRSRPGVRRRPGPPPRPSPRPLPVAPEILMIPLVRSIVHAMLWDPLAVRRWLRGLAISFSLGGVAFADQVAAVLGTPGSAKTVKIVALALAFIGASISIGQQNAKPPEPAVSLPPAA